LTATAGIISAITGLLVAFHQIGVFTPKDQLPNVPSVPSPIDPSKVPPKFLTPGKKTVFYDDFSNSQIGPSWKILEPNPSKWTLQPQTNSLLIITEKGSIAETNKDLRNQFVLNIELPKRNFEVIVKASFQILGTSNRLSIGLFKDDDNFLELTYWGQEESDTTRKVFNQLDKDFYRIFRFVKEEMGQRHNFLTERNQQGKGSDSSPRKFLLKIEREGHQYTGFYAFTDDPRPAESLDNVRWIKLGTHTWIDFNGKLSLWAANANLNIYEQGPPPEVAAEFDFVLIRERQEG
jgi:hypothetical protein